MIIINNQEYLEKYRSNAKIVKRVLLISMLGNIFLWLMKLVTSLIFDNKVMLSDSFHSLGDVGTNLLVIIATIISKPDPDRHHNYGHEKIESLMLLFFALFMGGSTIVLVYYGINRIINPSVVSLNLYLIVIAIISIIIKEIMFWYVIIRAKKTKSQILKAQAWDHRSDSFSGIAVIVGLLGCLITGNDLFESIAMIIIAILIARITIQILIKSINQLIDRAVDSETAEVITNVILATDGVLGIDKLLTRLFGNTIYVDVEIRVDQDLTVYLSHFIAHQVKDRLEKLDDLLIKSCQVHVNPELKK